MTVEVVAEKLRHAGRAARQVAERVAATDAGAQVEALAPAIPGGMAPRAALALATAWDERIAQLAGRIDAHSLALTSAADAYDGRDGRTAGQLGAGPW